MDRQGTPATDPAAQRQARSAQVRRLTARAGLLAKQAGLDVDAGLLQLESDRQNASPAAVVVAGEAKRGKSSLVNALVGRPGLLPVDTDIATGTKVVVTFATPEFARVFRGTEVAPEDIDVDSIADYASVASAEIESVSSIVVGVDSPFLARQLTMVDTPGVSGFVATHAERALMALSVADALLFVTDASSPLTLPELRFLERMTERVSVVVFALTKIDLHRSHRQIAEENRRLLQDHAPRFSTCPIFPVASPLAMIDDPELDGVDLERLRDESGIPALRRALQESVAERAAELRTANACRLVFATMARVSEVESVRLRATEHDPELQVQLARTKEAAQELNAASARWRQTLADEFQKLQADLQAMLHLNVSKASADLVRVVDAAGEDELGPRVQQHVQDAVEDLWLRSVEWLAAEATRVSTAIVRTLTLEGGGIELPPARPYRAAISMPTWDFATTTSAGVEAVDRVGTFTTGYIMSQMAFGLGVAATGTSLLIPGIVAAAIMGKVREKERNRRERRGRVIEGGRRMLADARTEISSKLVHHVTDIRRAIDDDISARLTARVAELQHQLSESQRIVNESAAERARVRSQAESRLAEARQHTDLASRLVANLEPVEAPVAS